MDGFTVSNSNRFLQTGQMGDSVSSSKNSFDKISVENPSIRFDQGVQESSGAGKSFADTLKEAVGDVNQLQKSSDKAIENLATGRTDNVADVMIASEKADIALRVMVQVRNKIIDAYNEVMKMQV